MEPVFGCRLKVGKIGGILSFENLFLFPNNSINYRNTVEILRVAYQFAHEVFDGTKPQEEDTPVLVLPESADRHGPEPKLVRCGSFKEEVRYLADSARQFHEVGTPWNEIAVVYRTRWMGQTISEELQRAGIPIEWVNRDQDSRTYHPAAPSVKLLTMHSSKGLEFPVVLIPGLGYMPSQNVPEEDEMRLLYVAMTRATETLLLTTDRRSSFASRLEEVIATAAAA